MIYTQYLYPLQIAAVMLLVAIIAAIALTLRKRKDSQVPRSVASRCVRRRLTALRIVKMKSEARRLAAAAAPGAQP